MEQNNPAPGPGQIPAPIQSGPFDAAKIGEAIVSWAYNPGAGLAGAAAQQHFENMAAQLAAANQASSAQLAAALQAFGAQQTAALQASSDQLAAALAASAQAAATQAESVAQAAAAQAEKVAQSTQIANTAFLAQVDALYDYRGDLLRLQLSNMRKGVNDVLVPVHNRAGDYPLDFPTTFSGVSALDEQALTGFLAHYSLPLGGTVDEKKYRLNFFLGRL